MGWFGNKDEDVLSKSKKSKVEEEIDEDDDSEEKDDDEDDDEESEEEENSQYDIDYECDNCGDEINYDIPCGITYKDFLKNKKCDNCGCYIIDREKPSKKGITELM